MVPARQPKSLLRALKGSIVGPTAVAVVGEGEEELLESERARSQLATVSTADDAGGIRRDVQGTRLLTKDCFTDIIKEE